VWIRSLLCGVGQCPGKVLILIYHDDQGSISWAEYRLRKVKHVEPKYHFTHYLIQGGQVKVTRVPSGDNCADDLCYALLRMRPLSILYAEGFLVISCAKVDYDKSGWRGD
jgi:hypothetical protein